MIALIAVLPFLSTLLGGMAALRLRHRLHPAMAAAAGILVATALVDLLPESIELIGGDRAALLAGVAGICGFLIYSAVEALIHQQSYEHGHPPAEDPDQPHEHAPATTAAGSALGWIAPAGLIVHSLLDGLAIGLGFEASTEVGIVVTLAVIVHDFADGLNIVTIALAGGRGRASAIALLGLDAAASIVGILASSFVALAPEHLGLLLGGFGGAFIAIGAGHLLPEAQHGRPAGAPTLAIIAAIGALAVVAIRLIVS